MSDYQGRTDVEFYAAEGSTTFLMSCRPCNGTGKQFWHLLSDLRVWDWTGSNCEVCQGRGIARFESPDVPVSHAPCHGTGRRRYRPRQTDQYQGDVVALSSYCHDCRGFGIVSLSGEITCLTSPKATTDRETATKENIRIYGLLFPLPVLPVEIPIEILQWQEHYEGFVTPCRYCDATGQEPLQINGQRDIVEFSPTLCRKCCGTKVLRTSSGSEPPVLHVDCMGTGRGFGLSKREQIAKHYRQDYAAMEAMRGFKEQGVGGATIDSDDAVVLDAMYPDDEDVYLAEPCPGCSGMGLMAYERTFQQPNRLTTMYPRF
jgi:hypothetical protein